MTTQQRTASYLTAMGVVLMTLVFLFSAYRTPLHAAAVITLITACLMWRGIVRQHLAAAARRRRPARRRTTRRPRRAVTVT